MRVRTFPAGRDYHFFFFVFPPPPGYARREITERAVHRYLPIDIYDLF